MGSECSWNFSDHLRRTPLHVAASEGQVEVVRLLLDGKVESLLHLSSVCGWTSSVPFHLSVAGRALAEPQYDIYMMRLGKVGLG